MIVNVGRKEIRVKKTMAGKVGRFKKKKQGGTDNSTALI